MKLSLILNEIGKTLAGSLVFILGLVIFLALVVLSVKYSTIFLWVYSVVFTVVVGRTIYSLIWE